jgi:hypothetical protein
MREGVRDGGLFAGAAKIRGEAAGKKEGLRKEAEQEIQRSGISPGTHKPEKGK